MMERMSRFVKVRNRFQNALLFTIKEFRKGNDHQGLDGFLNSMDDLESLLEMNQYLGTEKIKLDGILSILQELSICIKNQDVVGMTDLLEFTLYPVAKELVLENENENCQTG